MHHSKNETKWQMVTNRKAGKVKLWKPNAICLTSFVEVTQATKKNNRSVASMRNENENVAHCTSALVMSSGTAAKRFLSRHTIKFTVATKQRSKSVNQKVLQPYSRRGRSWREGLHSMVLIHATALKGMELI